MEVYIVTFSYFSMVWFSALVVDYIIHKLYLKLQLYFPDLMDNSLIIMMYISLQMTVLIILSYIIIVLTDKLTLIWVSDSNNIYVRSGIKIIYAYILFSSQRYLTEKMNILYHRYKLEV
jgi:hypothetical protein